MRRQRAAERAARVEVVLFALNDVYQFDGDRSPHGGYPRVCEVLRRRRRAAAAREAFSLLTLNGDFLGGSGLAVSSKGMAPLAVMEYLEPNFMVIGNHEFDYGTMQLQTLIQASKDRIHWLGSNVIHGKRLLDGVTDYDVRTYGDVKVGFFGLCTAASRWTSYPDTTTVFEDYAATASRVAAALAKEGCDVIVALTHLTLENDKKLAKAVPQLDVILGGHDHQPFTLYEGSTLIFKCGQNAYWLGELSLRFLKDQQGTHVFPSWSMHSTFDAPPDEGCLRLIESLRLDAAASQDGESHVDPDTVLVTLAAPLDTRTRHVRSTTTSSASLLADALMAETRADLGVINGGFIRGDTVYPKCHVLTAGDVLHELPFPRQAVVIIVSEADLLKALEQHLRPYEPLGCYPHLSHNCSMHVDPSAPALSKIQSLHVNGSLLHKDGSRMFKVAVSQFMYEGGDACSAWMQGSLLSEHGRIAHLLIQYLVQQPSPFLPPVQPRIHKA